MASRKKIAYKFYFFKGKRRIALARLRYADSFEVYYGKKRVIKRTLFPFKRVGERRSFLSDLVESIERKRLKILSKRRKKYSEAKIKEYRKKADRQIKLSKLPKDLLADELAKSFRESQKQRLVFNKASALPADTVRSGGAVKDSLVIPIAPDGMKYTKQVIDKMMVTPELGRYHLAILDLTLDKDAYVVMSQENFEEAYQKAAIMMLPSLIDYFHETKKSSSLYIMRIKFLNRWDSDNKYQQHGISWFRTELRFDKQVFNIFRRTFVQLFGPADPYDRDTSGKLRTNYLQGDRHIIITGVTFEAMSEEKQRRRA